MTLGRVSPEVGDTITWDILQSNDGTVVDRLLGLGFGRADVFISEVRLANVPVDRRGNAIYDTTITSFTFHAKISWPSSYKGVKRSPNP